MSSFTKVYWRSSGVPTWGLVLLTVAALVAFVAAENIRQRDPVVEENYTTMVTASRTMRDAMERIQPLRAAVEPINPEFDPQRSGLIGIVNSPVTTTRGGQESKPPLIQTGRRWQ